MGVRSESGNASVVWRGKGWFSVACVSLCVAPAHLAHTAHTILLLTLVRSYDSSCVPRVCGGCVPATMGGLCKI